MQALFPTIFTREFIRSNSISFICRYGILVREREVLLVFSQLHARTVLCIPEVNSLDLACSCLETVSILLLLHFVLFVLLFVCLPLSVCYSFFLGLHV